MSNNPKHPAADSGSTGKREEELLLPTEKQEKEDLVTGDSAGATPALESAVTSTVEEEMEVEFDSDGVAVMVPKLAESDAASGGGSGRQHNRLINPDEELTTQRAGQIALRLALPSLIENLLMSLVGMADMIMVGRLGAAATAAVGITNQPIFFATAIFQALNVGTTALVARLIGARDYKQANEAARQTLVLVTILGFIVSSGLFLFSVPILHAMKAEPDTMAYAIGYFRIVCVSLVFAQITMACNAQVRGAGDTRNPMINNTATNLINVVLNYLLINGVFGFPRMEVAGAATATAISRFVGMCMALALVFRGNSSIHISFKEPFRFNWDIARRVANVGLPSAIEQFVMRGGNLIFATTVTGLGTVTYASHVVAMNIQSLSMAPGMGFGMAATTLVGQSLGAKRTDWAEACGWVTQRMSMFLAVPMTIYLFFFGTTVARLYSDVPTVIEQAGRVLKIVAFTQVPQMSQVVLAGGLRGAGDTRWSLYSTTIGIWGVRVVLALLLVNHFQMGLIGAWTALAADQLVRSAIIILRFRAGHWKSIKV
ncbi:MAG: MATE family efflux transporter [Symbiobacteriaceae bacterium]|nr:MATE family efflux transporter [Symbiobacteriaceae bacterium]